MAGLAEQFAESLREIVGARPRAIPSAAPGAGPEAARESDRVALGGRIGSWVPRGGDATGFGGHGDAVMLDDTVSADVAAMISQHVARAQRRALHQPKPSGRIRLMKPYSLDAHIDDFEMISGPYSLFDGTVAAPSAGNSVQNTPIALPNNIPSPVTLLNRYPGAQYMNIFVQSFSFVPTGTTGTGLTEVWFTDGLAVRGLGVYVVSSQTSGNNQSIGALLTNPITDAGNAALGTLVFNNIGIGGTPTTVRYQLCLGYVAMVPDPWFNEQVVIPPTPSEIAEGLESMGAQ